MGHGIDWSAGLFTALPGAVVAIPAFWQTSLQMIVDGGLWFCLWRRQWRWLGVLLAIIGIYTARVTARQEALIGRNGKQVAVRAPQGRLAAKEIRYTDFEVRSWLESDGDTRTLQAATSPVHRRSPFHCDLVRCTDFIGKRRIAIPRSPATLADDCVRADLLVLALPKSAGCVTSAMVLDYKVMRARGTHAIYL
jgi:competence protein ComEC